MPRGTRFLGFAGAIAFMTIAGCASAWDTDYQPVVPADFGKLPPPTPGGDTAGPIPPSAIDRVAATAPGNVTRADARSASPAGVVADAPASDPGDAAIERAINRLRKVSITSGAQPTDPDVYVVDAMVGQVNGQAIYCSGVFEPLNDELSRLGRTVPRSIFEIRAKELIKRQLEAIVTDSLLLGEAERDLSDDERTALRRYVADERSELLRKWGNGSESVANQALIERTGKTLEQSVQDRRNVIIVQRYMRAKFYPKINVTRKDIERYYMDNQAKFSPPPSRRLRVIRAVTPADAAAVEASLAAGKPFPEVAESQANSYRNDEGGMWPDPVTSNKIFNAPELNDALAKLGERQASSRIQINNVAWWLYVDSVSKEKGKTLLEAQGEIEDILKRQRFQQLSSRYNARLYKEGSYNPIDQMTDALVAVAVSRFAVVD